MADGDGRYLLNMLEQILAQYGPDTEPLGPEAIAHAARAPVYDKAQEAHYNLISALHKSLRGSDPDAALGQLGNRTAPVLTPDRHQGRSGVPFRNMPTSVATAVRSQGRTVCP